MHELGIMTGVMDAVNASAKEAGATSVLKITLSIGEMTEAIEDALRFAFDVLVEGTMCENAELEINIIRPKSHCFECGAVYEHDRFHMLCPECGSFATELLAGRELQIDSIEVDIPDDPNDLNNTNDSYTLDTPDNVNGSDGSNAGTPDSSHAVNNSNE